MGAHRLPSKPARVWAVSCRPLSLFQEQGAGACLRRRVTFPGLLRVPLGSQQLWGCDLPGSSQGCGAQCVVFMGLSRGGPLSPVPPPRLGLPGAQSWSDGFSSLPTQPVGQFFTALVWTRLSAGVVCFQAMGSWCAPGGAELSILPELLPGQCVTLTVCLVCSCDCSGRVGANLFSSFPGLWYAFSSFSFLSFLSLCHLCVYVFLCVSVRYLKQQATPVMVDLVSCPDSPSTSLLGILLVLGSAQGNWGQLGSFLES